jgi:hypothetical protein
MKAFVISGIETPTGHITGKPHTRIEADTFSAAPNQNYVLLTFYKNGSVVAIAALHPGQVVQEG